MNTSTILSGLRLLLVEDEALVAMLIHDIVSDAGALVVGSAANIDAAISLIEAERIDGAILDVNLGGERIDRVAHELHARNIPFLFLTGYGRSGIIERFPSATVIAKPFEDAELLATLRRVLIKETSPPG